MLNLVRPVNIRIEPFDVNIMLAKFGNIEISVMTLLTFCDYIRLTNKRKKSVTCFKSTNMLVCS